jgi:hypothetical protein
VEQGEPEVVTNLLPQPATVAQPRGYYLRSVFLKSTIGLVFLKNKYRPNKTFPFFPKGKYESQVFEKMGSSE